MIESVVEVEMKTDQAVAENVIMAKNLVDCQDKDPIDQTMTYGHYYC